MEWNLGTKQRYFVVYMISAFFLLVGLLAARFNFLDLGRGLLVILTSSGVLITDYIQLAGTGPAFINTGLVILVTALLMYHYRLPMNGVGIMTVGFMAGFAMFGKNLLNMWFMLFGTLVYCMIKKESMRDHLMMSLLSTALGPLVSTLLFYDGGISLRGLLFSLGTGTVIGLVVPSLSTHTSGMLNDLSLYNGGFALGLLAMIICPLLKSYGYEFKTVDIWCSDKNFPFAIGLYTICVCFVLAGWLWDRKYAWTNYRNLLRRPGKPQNDFTQLDGMGAVMINMGINGAFATTVLLLIGGQLNGPTMGGILSIMGCSARGKHIRNISPVMLGICLASFTNVVPPDAHNLQLALLFGTSLAPIAGTYGFLPGVIAGFLHTAVILYAGAGYSGMNLYNNGFSAGIVAMVMWPMLRGLLHHPNTYVEPSAHSRELDRQRAWEERLEQVLGQKLDDDRFQHTH